MQQALQDGVHSHQLKPVHLFLQGIRTFFLRPRNLQVLFLFMFNNLSSLVFQLLHTLEDILQFLKLKTFEIFIEWPKRLSSQHLILLFLRYIQ